MKYYYDKCIFINLITQLYLIELVGNYINLIWFIILGSISSTSSQDQSPFHERMHTNSNAVPLMNNHLYQMDSSNQPPLSSGPPRTNAKGIYENPLPSIPVII